VRPGCDAGCSGLRPFSHHDIFPVIVAEINLTGTGDFLLRVEEHFLPLRDPTRRAADSEEDREHFDGESHRLINQDGIEIDVVLKFSLDEILVL